MFNDTTHNNEYTNNNNLDNDTMVTIISNNNRTDIYESNTITTFSDTNKDETSSCKNDLCNYKNNINIYRYKFTERINELLLTFSKIHQYDDRKTFKEAWEIWREDNKELLDCEIERLKEINYEGDIINKMFKSARYYFRKKTIEKKEPKKRRNYIGGQKEFLDTMDKHISSNIINNSHFKPSDGFNEFCLESSNKDLLNEEIKRLQTMDIKDVTEIKNKIKKTYKNRYFMLVKKI
jgi:hypothetical protein